MTSLCYTTRDGSPRRKISRALGLPLPASDLPRIDPPDARRGGTTSDGSVANVANKTLGKRQEPWARTCAAATRRPITDANKRRRAVCRPTDTFLDRMAKGDPSILLFEGHWKQGTSRKPSPIRWWIISPIRSGVLRNRLDSV